MKKILFLVALFAGFQSFNANAAITVTPGTGGTNICSIRAQTGSAPAFNTLGVITIAEGLNGDMANGFHTLTINAPAGWRFNTGAAPTLAFTPGRNITAMVSGGITSNTLTILFNVGGTTLLDAITITGLQVQATTTGSAAGNITASAAAGMAGITTGVTNFGSLSLTPALVPSVTIVANPAGAICAGTNVTFTATPVNGGTPTYQWFIVGVPVAGATNSTFSSTTLANGNTVRVVMTPSGCVTTPTVSSNIISMVVNATPAAVTVSAAGAYCDNTTLTASLAGAGTIYYQGVVYNGTSTATPSASQLITTPGTFTYYFRARSATAGLCWGPQGSARVTINPSPTALAVTSVTPTTFCQGDSATLSVSATAPVTEVFYEDFDAGLGSWVITNVTGVANSFWQVRNAPGWNAAVAGGGSPYMQAAPDATGAGITTTTRVESPSFSLAGYTTASLTFNQYFQQFVADITVQVEYSIDGGGSWVPFINQLGTTTGVTSWVASTPTTSLALPAATLNQPDVRLRWNYSSTFGWYWAIDNIRVSGTPTLTYNWVGVSGATGLSCATCNTVTITPGASGANVYSVSTTVAGCTTGTTSTITANPLPTVFNVTGGGASCAGGLGINVGLDGSEVGVDYQLFDALGAVGLPLAGTGTALDFGLLTAAGTYTVMATNTTTACTNAMAGSAIITLAPAMSPITGPTVVCEGATVTLANADAGGAWTSSDIAVASVDAVTGVVTGVLAGMVGITYTIPSGCFVIHDMTVNPSPVVGPITGITTLCEDDIVPLSSITPGGVWSSADPAIASVSSATGSVSANGDGTTTISYTVAGGFGCSTTVTTPLTVTGKPVVGILPAGSYVTLCNGSPANLVATIVPGVTYQWAMAGTPIAGETNHNYVATTPAVYTLDISVAACTWTLPSKTVLATPNAGIAYNMTGNYLFTGSFTTYQWFLNGTAITGATASILTSPGPGNYMVVVSDVTGCKDTSAIYTIMPTGISTPGAFAADVKVYPNPASSIVYINAPMKVNVSLITPDGRVVMESKEAVSINVSGLANGVYMLLIADENNNLIKTERFSKMD